MSLTGRFSALFLGAIGLVLVGFSTALYVSARVYLYRQVSERLSASLAVLAAAAEIHPNGVEWEPQERVLPLGQESGTERLRWMVFDEHGRLVDHSRNLVTTDLTPSWRPGPGTSRLPQRLVDRKGRTWQLSQRKIRPDTAPASGSKAAASLDEPNASDPSQSLHTELILTACAPLDPSEATLRTLGWFLVTLSSLIWLLAALLCRRISRRALTPLSRMVASAKGLDAADPGWYLDEAGTRDELDDLGRAFNELLSRLHIAYDRQRRFSSDASHQLRTPLTVLIGQIEVALRQERSGEEYRRVLRSALGRASHLGQIVEALLFLGCAEGESRLPEGEPVDLVGWVAEHLAGRPESGRSADIVHRIGASEPILVRAHPPLLDQLLDNLLDNACKYGTPGTPIVVEVFREGRAAVLAVEDTGPGIPLEDVPRVFEPFYRSEQVRRQGSPGVGLGLAVVQRIATAFAGTVNVRTDSKRGCRVEVRFLTAGTAALNGVVENERVTAPER
jgi:two-component system OmpR family sensor kinase